MPSEPTISVVMPAYNAGRYVAQAVESILAQTYTDFEFLIIDDGSTDRTPKILKRYAEQDPRICLVSRPNTGYVIALNEGLVLARGEFIARMDADDVALSDRFEIQVAYLRAHPDVVCVGGKVIAIDASGRDLYPCHEAMDHEAIQELALTGRCPLNHPSVMMRREAVLAVGGYRPEYCPAEDLDLFLRLAEVGRLANLPVIVTRYRLHSHSVSERQQRLQIINSQAVVAEASARLGLPNRYIERPPWRPTNRLSRFEHAVSFGWTGYLRGDCEMAQAYAVKAIRLIPWRSDGWRLLAYTVLKLGRRRTLSSTGPGGS